MGRSAAVRVEAPTEESIVDRNIAAVHQVRTESDQSRPKDQEIIDRIAGFAGSRKSLYVHILIYGFWMIRDISHGSALTTISQVASVESIFLAVFVLINQKRMNSLERKSSDLHLQMSLLAEHEVTRVTQLLDLVAKRFSIDTSQIENLEVAKKDVNPLEILEKISDHEQKLPTDSTSDELL